MLLFSRIADRHIGADCRPCVQATVASPQEIVVARRGTLSHRGAAVPDVQRLTQPLGRRGLPAGGHVAPAAHDLSRAVTGLALVSPPGLRPRPRVLSPSFPLHSTSSHLWPQAEDGLAWGWRRRVVWSHRLPQQQVPCWGKAGVAHILKVRRGDR